MTDLRLFNRSTSGPDFMRVVKWLWLCERTALAHLSIYLSITQIINDDCFNLVCQCCICRKT